MKNSSWNNWLGPVSRYCHHKAIKQIPNLNLVAICDKNKDLINNANVSKKYINIQIIKL